MNEKDKALDRFVAHGKGLTVKRPNKVTADDWDAALKDAKKRAKNKGEQKK